MSFAAASPIEAVESRPNVSIKIPSRMRVLVVDDDPLLLRALTDILESDGHQVVTANGQAGIDTFRAALDQHNPFAVVITDLGMPRVDGRAVANSVKSSSKSTSVILWTGWGQRLIAEGDIPPHVDRVLAKPPKLRDLREALAICISRRIHVSRDSNIQKSLVLTWWLQSSIFRQETAARKSLVSASLFAASNMRQPTDFTGRQIPMAKMKVAQVSKAKGDFEIVEREIPSPGPGQVRIKVQACGVCHSDLYTKEGLWPGLQFPRVPGHEVAGVIDEVGSGVTTWKKGDRAGVGWHGGQDNTCPACRAGDFANCESNKVTGITYDGGYQEYMVAPIEAVARIPDELQAVEAAPLLCAGITTFNALRHSGAGPGDLVAVQGIGGLGHLGIQFANKFGYRVAAVGRGPENAALAKKLGAHHYIDSSAGSAAEQLKKLGGANVIVATAPSSKAMSEIFHGLGRNGSLLVVGADMAPLEVPGAALISGRKRVQGWASGTPSDSEDTLRFAALTGVRPMIEKFPLAKVADAYARMISGHAQFRVVLTM